MSIDGLNKYLNRLCPIIPSSIDEASYYTSQSFHSLSKSILKLQEHDPLVLSFHEANRFIEAYDPNISNSINLSGRVETFKAMREDFLLKVLQFGEIYFASNEDWYEDLKDLSEESVKLIDPALIGKKRYKATDYYIVQICKIVYYSLNCFYHKCRDAEKVNQMVIRYELLAWADTYASLDEIFLGERLTPVRLRKQNETGIVEAPIIKPFKKHPLVQELLIQGLGIKENEEKEKEIQEIFNRICPLNRIKSYVIHPDGMFQITLDKARTASVQIPEFYNKALEGILQEDEVQQNLKKVGTKVIFSNKLMSATGLASLYADQVKLKVAEVITGKIVNEPGKPSKVVFDKNMIYLEFPFVLMVPNLISAAIKIWEVIPSHPVLDTIINGLSLLSGKTMYGYVEIQELANGTHLSDLDLDLTDKDLGQRILKRTLGIGFVPYGGFVWNWIPELIQKVGNFSLKVDADSERNFPNWPIYFVLDALKWDR